MEVFMGFSEINIEQKIRIALSEKANIIMQEDMDIFSVEKTGTFINTLFENFRDDAKSSISLYLQRKELEWTQLFSETKLDNISKRIVINQLKSNEEEILNIINKLKDSKFTSKLYHINNQNLNYLIKDCNENIYFNRPGTYLKCIIEEYCSLPFIQRERIYKKPIYERIETACKEKRMLKISLFSNGKEQTFDVYPYKLVDDPLSTQSYLVCYSKEHQKEDQEKIISSFSMARLNMPTISKSHFYLTKKEIDKIEDKITKHSPAYLLGTPIETRIRLTEEGKRLYKIKLFSRPNKIEEHSTENEYVFFCPAFQIFNYFFSFGANAEIISPKDLRDKIYETHRKALECYDTNPK